MYEYPDHDPRRRIWNAALKHFSTSGYAGTGVQQIVDDAGVTKPTLYYHFGSKAELYSKLIESAYTERLKVIEAAAATSGDIEGQLTAVGDALLDFAKRHKERVRLCYSTTFAGPGELPPGVDTAQKGLRLFRFIQSIILAAIDRGELSNKTSAEELTTAIFSQYMILSITAVLMPESLKPGIVARLVQIYLDGARKCSSVEQEESVKAVIHALNPPAA
ncbi:MAG: TetR/AcrR family transcriptional regulator [Verrucomicrobiota bacterium]